MKSVDGIKRNVEFVAVRYVTICTNSSHSKRNGYVMDKEFENSVHLDPELTWSECAKYIYDGVMDGKLNREDFIKLFVLSGQEMSEPRNTRIFAKALAAFFKSDFTDLKSEETPCVFVIVDNKNYLVSHNGKEITICPADDLKNIPDNSFVILHETTADAKIAAWEKNERYVEEV